MKNNGFLFGGALMAAGLAAQSAKADFIFLDTDVEVWAYHPNDPWAYMDYHDGPGSWSIFAACDGVASSEGTADALKLRAHTNIEGWAEADLTWCYFTVTEAATGLVSWDFGQSGDDFLLWNATDRVDLLNVAYAGNPEGTQQVSLEIDKLYFIRSAVTASNGVIETSFVDFVLVAPASCPWDLDDDDAVGATDLLLLLGTWGTNPGGPPDFDGDGNVGTSDLVELLGNWGPCPKRP